MVHLNIWGSISRCACVIVGISSSTDRSGKTESTSSRAHSCKYSLNEEEMSWEICNLWGSISRYVCVSTAGISNSTDRSGKTESASSRAHNSCKYFLNQEKMSWEICNLWGQSVGTRVTTVGISNSTDRSGKTESASWWAHSCQYLLSEEEMSCKICNLWGSISRYACVSCGHFPTPRTDPARLNQRAEVLASTSWTRKKCREKFAIYEVQSVGTYVSTVGNFNSTDRSGKFESTSWRAHSCKYLLNEE